MGGGQPFSTLDEAAAQSPPGANGVAFYPHLSGATSPHWRAECRGVFWGLSLSTGPPELARSVLEAVAFQIRENLEVLAELAGPQDGIILFGGGAKSAVWQQIIADVTGLPVAAAAAEETATRGAAMLAGLGSEMFPDIATSAERLAGPTQQCLPNKTVTERYDDLYGRYRSVEEKLLSLA
jgi:xylulokinase